MECVEAENADLRKTLNDYRQITGTLQYLMTAREGNVFRSVCLFTRGMMSLPVSYHVPSRGYDVISCGSIFLLRVSIQRGWRPPRTDI